MRITIDVPDDLVRELLEAIRVGSRVATKSKSRRADEILSTPLDKFELPDDKKVGQRAHHVLKTRAFCIRETELSSKHTLSKIFA
jgi:hypothetical protein